MTIASFGVARMVETLIRTSRGALVPIISALAVRAGTILSKTLTVLAVFRAGTRAFLSVKSALTREAHAFLHFTCIVLTISGTIE